MFPLMMVAYEHAIFRAASAYQLCNRDDDYNYLAFVLLTSTRADGGVDDCTSHLSQTLRNVVATSPI
jgi:hypothetical protein